MPLLVVGSVALDSVETPTETRENLLGGSAVFFSYAASYFTSVRLVGVVGEDWPCEHTELLRSRNIDTAGLQVIPGAKTFRWRGKYQLEHERRGIRSISSLNVMDRVRSSPARGVPPLPATCSWPTARPTCNFKSSSSVPAPTSAWPTRWTCGSRPSATSLDVLLQADRRPGAQRQRSQAAHRRRQPRPRRPHGPRHGPALRRHQEGRARGHVLQQARNLRPAGLSRRRRSSTPPAPATALPAA